MQLTGLTILAWLRDGRKIMDDGLRLFRRFEMLMTLANLIDWRLITEHHTNQLYHYDSAIAAGKELTRFIRNGFRVQVGDWWRETGELSIQLPALQPPTLEELSKEAGYCLFNGIERSTSPTRPVTLKLGTILRADEEPVDESECDMRLVGKEGLELGYQHGAWIEKHQDAFPQLMAVPDGAFHIRFRGFVPVYSSRRESAILSKIHGRWYLSMFTAEAPLERNGRIALGFAEEKERRP